MKILVEAKSKDKGKVFSSSLAPLTRANYLFSNKTSKHNKSSHPVLLHVGIYCLIKTLTNTVQCVRGLFTLSWHQLCRSMLEQHLWRVHSVGQWPDIVYFYPQMLILMCVGRGREGDCVDGGWGFF